MKKSITIISALFLFTFTHITHAKLIDRYTQISNIETYAQAKPLNTIISIKFAESIITVKQAIERLLRQSGYTLNQNYEAEKTNNFNLPKVHRQLGPIPLKRAIKVLLGPAWLIQVDETSRSIQIVQNADNVFQVLTPNSNALIKDAIKTDALDEVVAASIKDEALIDALTKVLPAGWVVEIIGDDTEALTLKQKMVSVISEDDKREQIIKKILTTINAKGFFYKKLKILAIKSNFEVIK